MVQFQATGLDKIQSGLKAAKDLQTSITSGAAKYTQELKKTTREIESMGRTFKGKEFRDRVRETDTLVRAQERLTRTMERQASLARLTTISGAAGAAGRGLGMLGNIAGGVATAGLGMGLAGMSGTVPMARFQNQMDRLQWELGNLLTPYLNIATKATAKAANWLGRQDVGTQNALGGVMVGGAGLLGANLASRAAFGVGIGTGARNLAGYAAGGAGMAFNAARGTGLATAAAGNMAYGTGGVAGLAGFAAPGLAATAALTLGLGAANSTIRLNNIEKERRQIQGGDSMGFGDLYQKKFGNMDSNRKAWEIAYERRRLTAEDARGSGGGKMGVFGGLYDIFAGNTRDKGNAQNENEARLMGLAQVAGEKPRPGGGHRQNMMVGGDFQEIGAGYYGAMSAVEKLRYDKQEGGAGEGNAKDSTSILQDILNLLQTAIPGGGGAPQPQQVKDNHAIPAFG